MAGSILSLHHVALKIKSIERSEAFYRKYAGMEVVHARRDGSMPVSWMRLPDDPVGFTIVLVELPMPDCDGNCSVDHFGVHVSDRETVDRIAAMAAEENCLAQKAGHYGKYIGYSCIVADPDGNRLEFACEQAKG